MRADRAAHHTTSRRTGVRLLVACCLLLGLLSVGAPAGAIDIPFDPLPIPGEDACNNLDAPIPASPHGFGSFIINPGVDPAGRSPDPFAAEHPASIESVYSTSPQWFTFDNGCTGQFMAGAGTALGNILLELGGILPNWSHLLLNSVLSPGSWLIALEEPVLEATGATARGVWSPWLPIVVLLVAVLIFLRARTGRFAASVSAAVWALLVLGLSSMAISYPAEIVHMVDDGVRNITGLIATGFNEGKALPEDPKDLGDEAAVVAVDAQFDEVIRTTQYRTWVTGTFGSPDSQTAIDYGPKVFAATHFTWEEYATYREDPEDAGAKIVEKKADAFKTYAEQIKETDPLAYEYFTGEHWDQRVTTSLVNLAILVVTCGFLLTAALATLLAYALIRLIVPFAPAMGVLFLIDRTRDAAVAMLKRVIGPLVMGPACFLVGLLLLRFFSTILSTESMWFVLKLGLIGVLTFLAWKFVRPQAYTVAPLLTRALAPLQHVFASRLGAHTGAVQAYEPQVAIDRPRSPAVPNLETAPGGVYHLRFEARAPNASRVLEPPEGFVPYVPPPRPLRDGDSAADGVLAGFNPRALPGAARVGGQADASAKPEPGESRWAPGDGITAPGPHAARWIPGDETRNFKKAQRDQINEIMVETGCHRCGANIAGTTSGNAIPDHQPPLSMDEGPYRLYPHCKQCSDKQWRELARIKQKQRRAEKERKKREEEDGTTQD